ncbi:MAG: TlpA disulfide reductase family protein [Edaphobacter sp.]|uniref:TlpA family protein disulfide reductase n=1 Tax=Edaphobacter sp. TaxID=1934404 RepID=UPI002394FB78|nr:TlpA disulfide reductase family protein [Edaphobacter sp.]MDE1175247.1 TlpA disulfide reductase family protein [Edaphobacter sp.]
MRRAVLGLGLLLTVAGCDRGQHPQQVNKPAPQFTVSDGTQSADLAKLRGKVVLLNFWATWCAPCIDELPSLMELQQRMPQVAVIAISRDEDPDVYKRFLSKYQLNLLTIRDPSLRIQDLYGTVQIPETYVIDRQGNLRRKFVSAQNWTSPEIMEYLSKL